MKTPFNDLHLTARCQLSLLKRMKIDSTIRKESNTMGYAADIQTFKEFRFVPFANDELTGPATHINH